MVAVPKQCNKWLGPVGFEVSLGFSTQHFGRQVLRQDGRKLVLQHRKAAGFPGLARL